MIQPITFSDKYCYQQKESTMSDAPSKSLLALEAARGLYEYGLGWLLNVPLQYIAPKGDGHPVIVMPGLGAADNSTHFMRNFLSHIGYDARPWALGRNLGPRNGLDILLSQLDAKLREAYETSGGKQVSLVGWSLGGIYSRELAKRSPDLVRQVITLGTPFKGEVSETNATILYELLSRDKAHKDPILIKALSIPPPVPFTSIYSKTDGVVSWESSIEDITDISENVEVPGASHLGLGHNPIAMHIIADRLSQPIGKWKRYNK
jgi:hypothetical protein